MRTAMLPGTFSPPTLGHVDLILRAAPLFDKLVIAVAENSNKEAPIFSVDERVAMLKLIAHDLPNVEVKAFDGLVVDCCQKCNIPFLVRGLRNESDFAFESQMALTNKQLCGVETVFLLSDPRYAHLSSSLVRELASYGRRLHGFVPESMEDSVYMRIASKQNART
jgi:pantetheine-phosphate adenylyltransferase